MASSCWFFPPHPVADEFPPDFDPVLLREAVQLEVITVSGHAPRLEYRRTIETRPEILTPPSSGHRIDSPSLTPFGTCLNNEGRIARQSGGACGYFLPLAQGHDAINLLPFDIVEIEGRFTGTWEVAASDIVMDADEGNVPIGLVTDVNSLYLPLLPLAAGQFVGNQGVGGREDICHARPPMNVPF